VIIGSPGRIIRRYAPHPFGVALRAINLAAPGCRTADQRIKSPHLLVRKSFKNMHFRRNSSTSSPGGGALGTPLKQFG